MASRPGRVAAAVLVAAAALAACSPAGPPPAAPPTGSPAASRVEAEPGIVRLAVPGGPDWLDTDGRFVYVRRDAGGVDRIDPATTSVVASVEVPGDACQGLGAAFGSVWTCRGRDVLRMDLDAGTVTATIAADKARLQGNLQGGFDRLWVLAGDGSRLIGIDPATNALDPPIELGLRGTDLAVGEGAVWVVSHLAGALVRVDPAARAVTARVDGLGALYTVAVGEGAVWASGTVTVRIAPDTAEVTTTVEAAGTGNSGALAVDDGTVLVRSADDFLQEIDAVTGEVRAVEPRPPDVDSGGDVLVAFGSVWTTGYDHEVLLRLDR